MRTSATLLALGLSAAAAVGDETTQRKPKPAGRFVKAPVTQPAAVAGMAYHLFVPDGVVRGQVYPLVFALHGNGQAARKLLRQLAPLSAPRRPVFLVAPQYQRKSKYKSARFPELDAAFRWVLDAVVAKHPIDRSRIYLQAVSHLGGEIGCPFAYRWYRASRASYAFRGLFTNSYNQIPPDPVSTPRGTAVFFVGGNETPATRSFPYVKYQRRCYLEFLTHGRHARYLEFEGRGHGVYDANLEVERTLLARARSNHGILGGRKLVGRVAQIAPLFWRTSEWEEAWQRLGDIRRAADQTPGEGRSVSALQTAVFSWWRREARDLGRILARTPDVDHMARLRLIVLRLGQTDPIGKRSHETLLRLARRDGVGREVTAQAEFFRAARLLDSDADAAVKLLQQIRTANADTRYGACAGEALQALGR